MTTSENLWIKALRDYWSDPRNIIGPPGALVRRLFKVMWLVVAVFVLFRVAGPSQVLSLQLWMEDDQLASDIAWAFTFASALCFTIIAAAAAETPPIRMPLLVPIVEFEEAKYRGWRIRPMHLHLPNIKVALGGFLFVALLSTQLYVMYNYYTHEQMRAGSASVVALDGSSDRTAEAEAALTAGAAAFALSDREYGEEITRTPANYATARARLMNERRQAANDWRVERARLERELSEARAAAVGAHQTFTDPRPADGQIASAVGAPRTIVAAIMDLLRSGVIEILLVLGAGLTIHAAPSRIGVPKGEADFAPAPPREEEVRVEETGAAPDAPPEPPPKRRFVLPLANAEDYEQAVAVGPLARVEAPPVSEPEPEAAPPPETEEAPVESPQAADAPVEEIDPLVAAHLNNEEAA